VRLTPKMKPSLRKTKSDKKNAKTIATFLSHFHQGLPQNSFLFSDFKDLAREREDIAQQIAKLKNDIEKLISCTFPELPKRVNIYSKTILHLLKEFASINIPIKRHVFLRVVSANSPKSVSRY